MQLIDILLKDKRAGNCSMASAAIFSDEPHLEPQFVLSGKNLCVRSFVVRNDPA